MDKTLIDVVVGMREAIAKGDRNRAVEVANGVVEKALDRFNAANTDVATSMLARAMVARAMIHVAALWLSDVTKEPAPACFAVIESFIDDPLPGMEGHCWDERTGQD